MKHFIKELERLLTEVGNVGITLKNGIRFYKEDGTQEPNEKDRARVANLMYQIVILQANITIRMHKRYQALKILVYVLFLLNGILIGLLL